MRFSNAIVRIPGENYSQGLTTVTQSAPELDKALQQHAAYCRALESCGVPVTAMPADETYPDGTFVEDTFVIAERVAIATRPGAKSRLGEVSAVARVLRQFRPQVEQIESPGTLDGGDICQVDQHFLIGLSARTNQAGAAQLSSILTRHGYTSSTLDIRKHPSLLHLKSGIAYLGERCFVVAPGFPAIDGFKDYSTIEVAAQESYAANCVLVNDEIFIAAGFPRLKGNLEDCGFRLRVLDMSEFGKMDGGLSCLSLRF
jgi:dimethylargininase